MFSGLFQRYLARYRQLFIANGKHVTACVLNALYLMVCATERIGNSLRKA